MRNVRIDTWVRIGQNDPILGAEVKSCLLITSCIFDKAQYFLLTAYRVRNLIWSGVKYAQISLNSEAEATNFPMDII